MNEEFKLKYDRKFLESFCMKEFPSKYKPNFHIWPHHGLINDPNCVFFYNNTLYTLFQHHPNYTWHGLKTMSLATTKDFKNYQYEWMVNKPDHPNDYYGVFSGNAMVINDEIICMYTGNLINQDNSNTSTTFYSRFNLEKKMIVDKKIINTNLDFPNYTRHFRDPYLFEFENEFYFLLGAQTLKEEGVILLFWVDKKFEEHKLIKEFSLGKEFRMLECPNIVFLKDKIIIFVSTQEKEIKSGKNPDANCYFVINKEQLFSPGLTLISNLKKFTNGFEFYAVQTFKMNDEWFMMGWIGNGSINEYPEKSEGWIHMLSLVYKIDYDYQKDTLLLKPHKTYEDNKILPIEFKNVDTINFYDGNKLILNICQKNNKICFERFGFDFYKYDNFLEIEATNIEKIEIFHDVSVLEIIINNRLLLTSRVYLEKELCIKGFKNE